ncbi:tetratricopeptide repeat protein 6 isoform X4 [Danio rerio]|nr:tetratricopeptide repeat protein 6 isoform X2 [Danio rerio]|eukprot:XP_021322974.1 tetratricopeptide repeat protein 6 isoform X2 [Danio rerio]
MESGHEEGGNFGATFPDQASVYSCGIEVGHSCSSDDEGPSQRGTSLPHTPTAMCRPPVPSGLYKMTESEKDVSDDGGLDDLLSQVTHEDIIMARGCSLTAVQRAERKTIQGLSLLATWTPKKDSKGYKTIHHLCTTPASQVVPVELQLASRICHTRNLITATAQFNQQRTAHGHISQPHIQRLVSEGVSVQSTELSAQTDCVSHMPKQTSDTLEDWQRIAEYYVERPRIKMCGRAATLCASELRMFWNPAPPKFICAPSVMKDTLFSKYQKTRADMCKENLLEELHNVVEDSVNHVMNTEQKDTSEENVSPIKCNSVADFRTAASLTPSGIISAKQARRPHSAPHLTPDLEPRLRLQSDFTSLSQEPEHVRWQQNTICAALAGVFPSNAKQAKPQEVHTEPKLSEQPSQTLNHRKNPHKGKDRARVSCSKRRATKKIKTLSSVNMAYVLKKLREPPRTLTRSKSLCQLPWEHKTSKGRFSHLSLPVLLDFESFVTDHGGIPDTTPPREWVRNIWDTWFDEVFPPLENIQSSDPLPAALEENQLSQDEDKLDMCEVVDEGLSTADLEHEVAKLTQALTEGGNRNAFDRCRRGALYIKLGYLEQALEDLSAAISLEPHLLDAYWHRHSIYLLRNDPVRALDDLNVIVTNNKKHADAFMSRAEIYKQRGETTLALFSYTQAIKVKPDDAEIYFKRAKMYDKMGEILLAMEDYAKTFTIDPTRTDAMMLHGMHHFNSSKWTVSLEDFSLLLKQEPDNAIARTYRGRIYSKLGHFEKSVEDLSLAVHLNPADWLAFYHRGCLLREIMPHLALRDFSTSVLINDSAENWRAFLHRGMVYVTLQHWQQAIADFEAVIKLDRSAAVAHVNLGMICMLKMDRHYEAIRRFNNALKADPTYVKAYVCRARAFYNVNNLSKAVKDLTRAIHLKPDAYDLYIMRGKFFYEMKCFDLAALCIQYAAEMKTALGLSAVQQAVIQSFLGNDANAIVCLEQAVDTQPSPPHLILLGRTLMKEHRFTEAVETFKKALSFLGSTKAKLSPAKETAEVFYLIGVCYVTQRLLFQESGDSLLLQALDAFNSTVSLNPDHAEAHHQRGLCRIHLQDSTGVQDFNRALKINPKFYQVHLSRAALYGAEGRHAKAILDCNEAIRIQPKSLRAHLYKGALKFYLKAYKSAVEDLTMAVQIDPACSFAYYNRGICFQELQHYEMALRDYSVTLLLGCKTELELKVLINRGLLYVELNDYSSALQDLKAAAQKRPADVLIYHALGVIHHRLGQLQEAVDAYSEAARLDPFLQDCLVGRGNVFMDYGHNQARKKAQRDFLSALHLNPLCLSARISLAYNLQVLGFFQRAWNQFTVAVEVNPKCWAAYQGRAATSLQMGNKFAALQDINTAIEYNPFTEQLFTNRGLIQQLRGDKSSAMKDYQTAISLNPAYALAYFNAANLFFYNGQFEQACEYYSRAFELDPSDESAILNRAITHALLRKVPESLQDFNEALCLNPLSAHAYFNRANLHCSLRQFQSAERDLTQALVLEPGDALLYKLRADVRGCLGWMEEAMEDYRTALKLQDS